MADDVAIRIRDQIASQIVATSYSIHTSRHFALQEADLPAVCVVLGDDAIEQATMGADTEMHEQEYALRVYGSAEGDVDAVVRNTMKTVDELIATDRTLSGLALDCHRVSIGAPERAEGTTKFLLSEVIYRVTFDA